MADDNQDSVEQAASTLSERYPRRLGLKDPPMELIEGVKDAIQHLDDVGFPFDTLDRLNRFEKGIYDGLRPITIVDGKKLVWVGTDKEIMHAILNTLSVENFTCLEAWKHLQLFREVLRNTTSRIERDRMYADGALISQGLVFIRRHIRMQFIDPRGTTYVYAVMNKRWAEFFVAFRHLELEIANLPRRGRAEGRVLTILESSFGWRLLHPDDWKDERFKLKKDAQLHSVLTGNLPDSWAYPNLGPRGIEARKKKREALNWLYDLYQVLHPARKRASKDDVFEEITRLFGEMSGEMQKEIWREADVKDWKRGGQIPEGNRYTFDKKE